MMLALRTLAIASLLFASACGAFTRPDSSGGSAEIRDPRERNAWFAAGRHAVAEAPIETGIDFDHTRPAKNVILFVGDGMGTATITAARILEGQLRGEMGEENRLAFEMLPFAALSKTYNVDAQVSDSASTMTAIVSGVKTLSGVLGVDERIHRGDHTSVDQARVLTILEEAEARGLATGVVSTATVTHATPAACYAHVPVRFWQSDSKMSEAARVSGFPDIARQLVEFSQGDGLEVALGGGRSNFMPIGTPDAEEPEKAGARVDGRNLAQEWVEAREGAVYVWNRRQFDSIDREATRHLLGLFEPGNMKFEADRESDAAGEPSLAEMTDLAIDLLARDPDGYFLMVEGGRIDHGHHDNNAYRALTDTLALSDAVHVALTKTRRDDTLIVVTADHSHTLMISGYPNRGNPILGKVVGTSWWSREEEKNLAKDLDGKPFTTLSYANGPGHVAGNIRPDLAQTATGDKNYLQEATVPLKSETHAGEDVPIFAGGPRAALFHGVQEQHYIYHAMVEAFGWTRRGVPVRSSEGQP